MNEFWFYIKLGFEHVLDLGAYDHILFLAALAVPFTFKSWKKVLILATIFTIAHCTSLALSAFGIVGVNALWIEFLIPVTIALTAIFNLYQLKMNKTTTAIGFHSIATAFFGLVHGFGFSNYFNMLMAEEENKLTPLLGFATGIEFSQVVIVLLVLSVAFLFLDVLKVKQKVFIAAVSALIVLVTIPMLIDTFPL